MSEITLALEHPSLGCGEIIARYDLSEIQEKAYQKGRADAEKDDLIKACIEQLKESDADEVKVSADTKDGYRITVIVELKEQS